MADIDIRTVLANAYTFVRSNGINSNIAIFTFDHYIEETKKDLMNGARKRPSKLAALEKVERDFINMLAKARELANLLDAKTEQEVDL